MKRLLNHTFVFIFFLTAIMFFNMECLAQEVSSKPMLGFSKERVKEQRTLEAAFDSYLSPDSQRAWMKYLTTHAHHVGSPYDSIYAEFIARKFKSWGFDTKIEKFQVLFPTPKMRQLEVLSPELYTASLAESPLKEDATSNQTSEQLPIYNAYSIDGDVTGELVYVNNGVPRDYEELEKAGVDVKGKIVIARYGGAWRGIKPKVAAEHGAIGCIIYSDPAEDGYYQGDEYPTGAFRNRSGAQRGSVSDMPVYPGDPLTPSVGATNDAIRITKEEAPTLSKIPVLPISYGDALPLLRNLKGQVVPESWRGALPITYHFGPGPAKVHLKLEFNWDLVPIYDVIAAIKGAEHPDEWILRGNHHDAWAYGAGDPVSGLVAEMSEAYALGKLMKEGWKPNRTIVYCAWDGEEPGLLGSTEWVETHFDELKAKAAVYINSDGNGRGFLYAGGSHSLEKFVSQVTRDVIDPEKNISVFERARALRIVNSSGDDQKDARDRSDSRLSALGSGSDYTPFLQHVGIASLSFGYGGESDGGSYHSIFDSYSHFTRFGDPTLEYGIALAQTSGRSVLRFANADMLPFDFNASADAITKYMKEVLQLTDDIRRQTEENNKLINEKYYELTSDPHVTFIVPKTKDPVPYLNFSSLQNAATILSRSAGDLGKLMRDSVDLKKLTKVQMRTLDTMMIRMEQLLTRKEGLPGRPWYIHQIYAPGKYTGYGVKTLPPVREAIELRNWKEASEQIEIVASVITGYSNEIVIMTGLLRGFEAGK